MKAAFSVESSLQESKFFGNSTGPELAPVMGA